MTFEDFPGSIPIQQRSKPKDTPYHSSMFFKQSNSQLVSLPPHIPHDLILIPLVPRVPIARRARILNLKVALEIGPPHCTWYTVAVIAPKSYVDPLGPSACLAKVTGGKHTGWRKGTNELGVSYFQVNTIWYPYAIESSSHTVSFGRSSLGSERARPNVPPLFHL
jgi:hypothetical protein